MKCLYLSLLLVISCSSRKIESPKLSAAPTNLELSQLKPKKPQDSQAPLSNLRAELFDDKGALILMQSAPFGDCVECARGFSVKKIIGIRVEGVSLKALRVGRKQSSGVKLVDCPQNQLLNGNYNCQFSVGSSLYTLRLSLQ